MNPTIQETDVITVELLMDDKPEYFTGTPAEIVEGMNNTAMAPETDSAAYMARFQRFAKLVAGHEIRVDNEAVFVESMIGAGLARTVDRPN